MASLTQVSITTRKVIRYGVYFAIFLVIARVVLGVGIKIYRTFFPAPPPPPTVSFGKLPKLPFPQKDKVNLTFTLETPEGGYPKLAPQAKVYFMPKPSSGLLSLDITREKVRNLGFDTKEEAVSQTVYRFRYKEVPATLTFDIVTGGFSISYDLAADPSILNKRPPAGEVAASNVRSYLSSANLLPSDLTGPTTYEFLKPQEGKLVPALSLSDSNIAKVNFFRKSFDSLPSLTPDPTQANVWFLVSGEAQRGKQVVAAEYHYFSVDEGKTGTYPLKTSQAAWEELTKGGVYIASLGTNKEGDSIKIRRIYLAYYDAGTPTDFFQPIIVFEGDHDFVAYAPAVTSEFYGE